MTTTSRRRPAKAPKKPKKGTAAVKTTATPRTAAAAAAKPAPKPAPKAPSKSTAAKPAAKKSVKQRTAGAAGRSRPAASRRAAPRTPFVLLVVGLLGGALVSLLLLNTVLARDAFTLTRLQQSTKQLEQQRQAYEEENAREGSPANLEKKARALGLKKAEDPVFFNPETGQASGGAIRPVPPAAAASAGAAGVVGVPGTVVPGDDVRPGTGAP
ncbi:hypothetical protein [Actinomadura formosensis]|uniref:hypothetical protein n=1 Tax=Actinomadura formosensis TaxID=60706 RepID=UPI003D94233A